MAGVTPIFDVRPVDKKTRGIDLAKIRSVSLRLDLSTYRPAAQMDVVELAFSENILPLKATVVKEDVATELERELNRLVQKKSGFRIQPVGYSPRRKGAIPIAANAPSPALVEPHLRPDNTVDLSNHPDVGRIHAAIRDPKQDIGSKESGVETSLSQNAGQEAVAVEAELERALAELRQSTNVPQIVPKISSAPVATKSRIASLSQIVSNRRLWVLALIFVFGLGSGLFVKRGVEVKTSVSTNGAQAVVYLQKAKQALFGLQFAEAAEAFLFATENFESARSKLEGFRSFISGILDALPVLNKTKDAQYLAEVGQLISQAGAQMSAVLTRMNDANLFALAFKQQDTPQIIEFLKDFRRALITADRALLEAQQKLAQVDFSIVPQTQREMLTELQKSIPQFSEFLNTAIEYSGVAMDFFGQSGPVRYAVLFQNSAELRPTGGFPGSYAVVEFDRGHMRRFFVDDIYNPDGQLKQAIVPPKPLQKITPLLAMRDVSWWPDFPTSAQKVYEFYKKERGEELDGIIAFNLDLAARLLEITGPIELPDYGITLSSDNLQTQLQSEVEYGENISQPKTILRDFAPKFLERLGNIEQTRWGEVAFALLDAFKQRSLMFYFVDPRLQRFALSAGVAGEIREFGGDYLMVNHTNIMGSKSDAVTDSSLGMDISFGPDNTLEHQLTISRTHNGGKREYAFFNKTNNDYVRVYLPSDAELISISGNSDFTFKPLIDYENNKFEYDPDLVAYENAMSKLEGIDTWQEKDKRVFGFWMVIKPGETKEVTLRYRTSLKQSDAYSFLAQRQPGAKSDLALNLDTRDQKIKVVSPKTAQVIGNKIYLNGEFKQDVLLGVEFE